MQVIADLQIHSKFSRAVSKEMTLPNLWKWGKKKGIGLMATGDWTHPLWMNEIDRDIEEIGNGFLKLKSQPPHSNNQTADTRENPVFALATEVSCIYSQGGKGRRVHTLIWVPTLESARKISKEMTKQGCNLMSDGRPIIGLTSMQVAELVFSIEPKAIIIPAHAWTPWFALYGSMSGFDSLSDAFGPYADRIYAVETGLSSNPSMNWQIKELDQRSIVSFSDAHSGPKLGREATVFDLEKLTYDALFEAVIGKSKKNRIEYTIEFYPEEGKYHYTGHRACNIRWDSSQVRKNGTQCPVCGKPLTQGVMQRVEELAARTEDELDLVQVQRNVEFSLNSEIKLIGSNVYPDRPPFLMMVPLTEIIAECIHSPVASPKVTRIYDPLIAHFGNEFTVLLRAQKEEVERIAGARIAEGISKVRAGNIAIDSGYDGVFGVVKLWKDDEDVPLVDASREQLRMF